MKFSEVVNICFQLILNSPKHANILSFIDNTYMTICFQMLFFLKNRQFLILDLIYCVRINSLVAVYLASVLLGLSYEAFWKNFRELHVLFSCGKQCSHLAKRYKIALDVVNFLYIIYLYFKTKCTNRKAYGKL